MAALTVEQALQIALAHHQAGRLAEAEAIYRQILAVEPRHADALHFLGVIAHQVGRDGVAVEFISQAIAIAPGKASYHSNLGEAYRQMGRSAEAIACYERAIQVNPDFHDAYANLANALTAQGRLDEAIATCERAIALHPGHAHSHYALGNALINQGRPREAVAAFQRAVDLRPDFAEAMCNLGAALTDLGRLDEAFAACGSAVRLNPALPDAHNNLGNVLVAGGRPEEAATAYREAIRLNPNLAAAIGNLGNTLTDLGRLDEGVSAYRRAIELAPGDPAPLSGLIDALHFHPAATGASIAAEQRRWENQIAAPLRHHQPHPNGRSPVRRLRIGLVSPGFREHVFGRNFLPLFEHCDREGFELIGYSGVAAEDSMTAQFRRHADRWHSTLGMSADALAAAIRADGVDILVDLSQHMAGNRLPVFARRPAPVQVSFAGYPASTGLESIAHRITDRHLESGTDGRALYPHEQLHFLDSFWCYERCAPDIPVNPLPALAKGHITFGCVNTFCKVNAPVLRLWARILARVPHSRIVLMSPPGSHRNDVHGMFATEGIAAERIEFTTSLPLADYFAQYHRLDVALDTFPYNGHTTSLDALWMGVPVVSLAGTQPVSRAGLSQLTNLGLPELVADTADAYVTIAVNLAGDPARLAGLRGSLREKMRASVLMDGRHFAGQIEHALRAMWQHWCARS